jgi:hypothetical protein
MGDPRYLGKPSDRTLDAPICGFLRATAKARQLRRRPLDKLYSLEVASGSIPLFLIVSEAHAEARNSISRLELSISSEPATTAADT